MVRRYLSHSKPGQKLTDYRSWTTSWDQGCAQILRTHTTKSNFVVHGIITLCTLQFRDAEGASPEYKEETRMGSGQRGRQSKVQDEGDGSRPGRRGKKASRRFRNRFQTAAKTMNFSTRAVRQNAEHMIPDDVTKWEGARETD